MDMTFFRAALLGACVLLSGCDSATTPATPTATATVLDGKVDAVLLTGGIVHNEYIVEELKKRVGFIAPVYVYPGEREMLSLGQQTYYALIGKEEVFEL